MMQRTKRNVSPTPYAESGGTVLNEALKSEVGERPSVEVRLLEIDADGKLQELSCLPLSYYGSCPNVGDTVVDGLLEEASFYSVQRRYFVQDTFQFAGWALIVRKIEPTGPPMALWQEWRDATRFWDDVAEKEAEKLKQRHDRELQAVLNRSAGNRPSPTSKPKTRRKRVLKPRMPPGNNPEG
jgi:hypothetical protein